MSDSLKSPSGFAPEARDTVARFRELLAEAEATGGARADLNDRHEELGFFFDLVLCEMSETDASRAELALIGKLREIYAVPADEAVPVMQRIEMKLAVEEFLSDDYGMERLQQARMLYSDLRICAQLMGHSGKTLMPIFVTFDAVLSVHEHLQPHAAPTAPGNYVATAPLRLNAEALRGILRAAQEHRAERGDAYDRSIEIAAFTEVWKVELVRTGVHPALLEFTDTVALVTSQYRGDRQTASHIAEMRRDYVLAVSEYLIQVPAPEGIADLRNYLSWMNDRLHFWSRQIDADEDLTVEERSALKHHVNNAAAGFLMTMTGIIGLVEKRIT